MRLVDRLENLLAGYDPRSHDFAALEAAITIVKAAEQMTLTASVAEMESDPEWRKPEDPVCYARPGFLAADEPIAGIDMENLPFDPAPKDDGSYNEGENWGTQV